MRTHSDGLLPKSDGARTAMSAVWNFDYSERTSSKETGSASNRTSRACEITDLGKTIKSRRFFPH
jgi:hypothetical protein